MAEKQSEAFHTFLWHHFTSLKHNFIAYRSSKVPDCIFDIHLLWQSGFSRVYSNCCCSCSFEPEIIKIGLSSHTMYCNKILNFQESTTILNAYTKKSGNLLNAPRTYSLTPAHTQRCSDKSRHEHIYLNTHTQMHIDAETKAHRNIFTYLHTHICSHTNAQRHTWTHLLTHTRTHT